MSLLKLHHISLRIVAVAYTITLKGARRQLDSDVEM
jgi:hypothetical protein